MENKRILEYGWYLAIKESFWRSVNKYVIVMPSYLYQQNSLIRRVHLVKIKRSINKKINMTKNNKYRKLGTTKWRNSNNKKYNIENNDAELKTNNIWNNARDALPFFNVSFKNYKKKLKKLTCLRMTTIE